MHDGKNIKEKQTITTRWVDGNLLLPMGALPKWLYNNITHIKINFADGFSDGDIIEVDEVTLYRLI